MDYTNYSVEDLASDDSFILWVHRAQPEAVKRWDLFLAEHPEMSMKIAQARTLVTNLKHAETLRHSDKDIDALWKKIEDRIDGAGDLPLAYPKKMFSHYYALAAVMCLIFFSVAGWYTLYYGMDITGPPAPGRDVADNDFIEEVNTTGNILRVHLSDGSTVALENNSRLKYKRNFRGEPFRTVFLVGEAFFEVTKDASKPFIVHANEVVTRVLGTSFRVIAPENDGEVIVTVKTGKVSVYALMPGEIEQESQKNGVILLPNQQVTYVRSQDSFGKALVAEPEIVQPTVKESDFTFENTPIKEVFQVLQEAYGVEIIFDEEVLNNCFITAPLGSEPLFEKLKIICRTIGARYETIDARVVITSAGC